MGGIRKIVLACLALFLLLAVSTGMWLWWSLVTANPTISLNHLLRPPPMTPEPTPLPPIPPPKLRVAMGFVPYWELGDAYIPPQLTHVIYAQVDLQPDGQLHKMDGRTTHPGWREFRSPRFAELRQQTSTNGQKLILMLAALDEKEATMLLSSPSARQTSIAQVRQLLLTSPIDGINLDIEIGNTVTPQLRTQYTEYVHQFREMMNEVSPALHFSIDMTATGGQTNKLWDIASLHPLVDHIVVMGYDFHYRGSPIAGPVAPLYGKSTGRWDADLSSSLRLILQQTPAQKLILGIPLYGYQWQTTSPSIGSTTFPRTGQTVKLKDLSSLVGNQITTNTWDWDALSPYLTYQTATGTNLVAFESTESFAYKFELAQKTDMDGVAFWALGYAHSDDPVWKTLEKTLQQSPKN